ncbi:Alpha/Beta hydrolase protein [Nemania sp. FL0916]|nr:Alpha/Beta hydrolase protein [Nemania sp. FL0916]
MSLEVLVEGPQTPSYDIVAVHGLNGHYLDTWRDKPGSPTATLWLRDLLPEKLPGCRVMTFEYDASIHSMSTGSVRSNAKALCERLYDKREDVNFKETPIVFVGHSLGGIVIKQALSLAEDDPELKSIATDTKGIVFFGTPHRGSDAAQWGLLAKNIAGAVVPGLRSGLLKALQRNSDDLYKISEDFHRLSRKYAIVSFYEEYAYRIWGKVIVDKSSAIMGLPHEQNMMLSGTHTSMCRFSKGDKQFDAVWRRIKRAGAGPPTHLT